MWSRRAARGVVLLAVIWAVLDATTALPTVEHDTPPTAQKQDSESRNGVGHSPSSSAVGKVGDVDEIDELATPPIVLKNAAAAVSVVASHISSASRHLDAGIEIEHVANDHDEHLDTAALIVMAPHVQALIEDQGLVHVQGNFSVVSNRRAARRLMSLMLRGLAYLVWIAFKLRYGIDPICCKTYKGNLRTTCRVFQLGSCKIPVQIALYVA